MHPNDVFSGRISYLDYKAALDGMLWESIVDSGIASAALSDGDIETYRAVESRRALRRRRLSRPHVLTERGGYLDD